MNEEKRTDRLVLGALYKRPMTMEEIVREMGFVEDRDEAIQGALLRLRRDGLLKQDWDGEGFSSWRLSPAVRLCLDAVGRL